MADLPMSIFPTNPTPVSAMILLPCQSMNQWSLTWECEDQQEAAMDGHGEVLLRTKHSWRQSDDTLESIVHSSLSRKPTSSNPGCKDETLMSLASTDQSHKSYKTENSVEDLPRDDGSLMNKEVEHIMRGKTNGSSSIGRTRKASNRNQSERKRRDRINQQMKDLQKLVPNGSKMDRCSLLDGTIQYLKQLQAQVQFMCSTTSSTVSQMFIPLGIQQQQIQMSLLAAHMGLLHTDSVAPAPVPSLVQLHFLHFYYLPSSQQQSQNLTSLPVLLTLRPILSALSWHK